MMPRNLILVRHGESEGNIANKRSREGDHSAFDEEFMARHSSSWRLTDLGVSQAAAAGTWLRTHQLDRFSRYYVSGYIRAMETAVHLSLPDAVWYEELYLRERDWGDLDVMPHNERKKRFAEVLAKRDVAPLFWSPPGGVPIIDVRVRTDRVLDTLHRECSQTDVIIVCHAEAMWALRLSLERISSERFKEIHDSRDPKDFIHNCQIIHYTRVNDDGTESSHYTKMRSICPWNMSLSTNDWQSINRPRYSNEELATRVMKSKRQIT